MKRCPSCQQTYPDDAPDYCSNDGMRLVDEEAAGYDPERTIMSSGLRGGDLLELDASPAPTPPAPPTPPSSPPAKSSQPPSPPQQYQSTAAPPPADIKPPTEWQPPHEPSPQSWQTPGGQAAQPGWQQPQQPQQQQQQQPAQNWGGVPAGQQQQPAYAPYGSSQPVANAPYAAPYTHAGRSRALSIAALVTGACAVTIMALLVARSLNFTLASLLSLAILGIGLGVASLILSLQKPARFGGIPLAIAGLAMGTAALVYYFTR
jgi:hypothetical protein